MNEAADARYVANVIKTFLQFATHENITGKKWFNDTHHAALGRALQAQTRMEHLQVQFPGNVSRCNVFVLRFGSGTIPAEALVGG